MPSACPQCGTPSAGTRFCVQCGHLLATPEPAPGYAAPTAGPPGHGSPVVLSKPGDPGAASAPPPPLPRGGPPAGVVVAVVLAGVLALVGVAALVVALTRGGDDTVTASPAASTSSTSTSGGSTRAAPVVPGPTGTGSPGTTSPRATSTRTPTPTRSTSDSGSSSGPAYWTVVVESVDEAHGGSSAAYGYGSQVAAAGYDYDVFWSSDYSSLRPGYWVVASGRFSSRSSAGTRAESLKAAGFAYPYPRCVGTSSQCS